MTPGATLCLDSGTTLVKAVVFDSEGLELVSASRPARVDSPQRGYAEQDMDLLWDVAAEVIAEASAKSPIPVDRLAITAQGDGAWLIGHEGEAVRPAILWNDARSRTIVDSWQADGVLDAAFTINGSHSNLGVPNSIVRHLLAGNLQSLDAVHAVVTCGSWLFSRLTGVIGLHVSDASAPWLDIAEVEYSQALLQLYGLADQARLLPPLLDAKSSVQPLIPSVAERVGLPVGIPVVLAPYDVVTAAAGSGAVANGDGFCILGTTLCTGLVIPLPDTSSTPAGLTLAVAPGAGWIRAFPTLAGTGVVDWMTRLFGLPGAADFSAIAAESAAGAHGVSVWPYLSTAGERAPFLDPDASGVVTGLTLANDRGDLARATVEGLAHVIRDCLEAMPVPPVSLALAGGGAASDLWCSVIADVTGTPTVRLADSQIGAKGALVHALVATGHYPSLSDAVADLVRVARRFEPDDTVRGLHDDRHDDFLESRALFATRWHRNRGRK